MNVSQRSPKCHNHRALSAANSNRKNLDATGVGAVACARHGCYVPHSVVDFQKGERFVWHNIGNKLELTEVIEDG